MAKKIALICLKFHTRRHNQLVNQVKRFIKDLGIRVLCFDSHHINGLKLKGTDVIITLGGDGTFLRASHFQTGAHILCINSDPTVKEGFFARANGTNYRQRINQLLAGNYKITKLTRLVTKIGSDIIEPALNEVYIGHKKPYIMSRYYIKVNGRREFQKSSGVLVATASGSHAWLGSAGGKKIPMSSKRIQYSVRDSYAGNLYMIKQTGGFVKSKRIEIVPHQTNNCIVVIDSLSKEYRVPEGVKITIKKSKHDLNMVYF